MKLMFFYFFLICSFSTKAQELVIKQEKKTHFINMIDNPISFIGNFKNSYSISTTNGSIEKNIKKGTYIIRPNKLGLLIIEVRNKKGKLILSERFNVRDILFDVNFYGIKNGVSDINFFLNHNHLQLLSNDLECLDFFWQWTYEVIHINEKYRYQILNINKSSGLNQLKDKLSPLEKGDILLFKNIKIYLDDLEYSVPDKIIYIN